MATTEEILAPETAGSTEASHDHSSLDHSSHDHSAHEHEHHHHPAPATNPELTRSIEVEAPVEEVDKAFRAVTKKYAREARIPGFRAGKVPPTLIRSRFSREVRQEVLESLVNEKFRSALEVQKLQPVSQPQVSELLLAEGAPMKFKATFEVLPDISIAGYDTVTLQKPETTLTEDEFQAEIGHALERHATIEPVEEDRPLVDTDWAEISFKGQVQELAHVVGEETPADATPEAQPITGEDVLLEIGGPNTLPSFNEALRGAKVGQELTFEVNYPAEFGEQRLAGKTVAYDVTVKAIKKKIFPERTDDFAKELGNYETWADFEAKMREYAQHRKSDALLSRARSQMVDDMVARFHFPVPETFVQQQVDARLERGLRALAQQGMTSDAMRQLNFEQLRAAQHDEAVKEVKASLILDRIALQESITVTDEDLDRELLMLSIQQREPLETLRKRLTEDGSLERIREQMLREKTSNQLYERLAK